MTATPTGPPDARYCAAQAAATLRRASERLDTICSPDDRARLLDAIAKSWLALAVAIAEHPNMAPEPPEED